MGKLVQIDKMISSAGFNLDFDDYVYAHWKQFVALAALAYAAGQRDMRERAAWECDDMIRNGSFLAEDIQNAIRALPIEGENQ